MEVNILNQKSNDDNDKTNDKYLFDDETEFLLGDYDPSSSIDDLEELSNDKIEHEGVKVMLHICFINFWLIMHNIIDLETKLKKKKKIKSLILYIIYFLIII